MADMVNVNTLTMGQLNQILTEYDCPTTGNKAARLAKVIEVLGTDQLEADQVPAKSMTKSVETKIEELQTMVGNLATMVQQMTQRQNEQINHTSPPVRQTDDLLIGIEDTPGSLPRSTTTTQRNWTVGGIKELSRLLPEFDPIHGVLNAEQFLEKVAQLKRAYTWSEEEVLIAVQGKLKGAAQEWAAVQPVFDSWAVFASKFKYDFPCTHNSADIHREMAKRRRSPNETLKEYYYAMLNIGRRGKVDESSINSYIIAGLNDYQLTRTLSALNLQTSIELLQSIEKIVGLPQSVKPVNEARAVKTEQTSHVKSQPTFKCFNCNEAGHVAAKCPKPQRRPKCNKCGKNGHEASTCRMTQSSVARLSSEDVSSIHLGNVCWPAVLKEVLIDGEKLVGFIDTGSDQSLIAESKVPARLNRQKACINLRGFGGAAVQCNEVIECNIELDECKTTATFAVVKDNIMTYDVLIGQDVLGQKGCKLIIDAGVLKITSSKDVPTKINEDLPRTKVSEIRELLNEYHDCFAENMSELGRCKTTTMEIRVTTEDPIVGKRYQVPLTQRPTLTAIVDNLLDHGIIRPSTSPHAAPVLLVKKANGEDRMCVDFRALNAVTVKKQFPMPIVEEQLAKLPAKCYFSTLDMTSGYYQVPLEEESKKFTAFITPEGLFEHNVMPFGLVNAPMVFQEMVTGIIRTMANKDHVISYVDEVIIATRTSDEAITVLREWLDKMREFGLTLRPSKCTIMATEVKFLGHIISAEGIRPGEEKTRCIADFPTPETAAKVRQFLGVTGFFRKFMPKYSLLAKPLTVLLRKEQIFIWGQEQETAFNTLKQALMAEPVLVIYDPHKKHEIHTDASALGISGIFLQLEETGWKAVQYFSRQCSAAESNYASHELEVLAVVETLERFRIYLLGHPFTVVTDCNAIATTKASSLLRPRIARWWLRLQEFNFECVHRPGNQMQHVDTLSRCPVGGSVAPETVAERVMAISKEPTRDWVYALQMHDDKLKSIAQMLKGEINADESLLKQVRADYVMKNNRLERKVGEETKLVVPGAVRWRVTKACHDDVGHFAEEKTLQRIATHFWFPRMRRFVKSYISACEECCINKIKGGKRESQLHISEIVPVPFRMLFIDHLGPFPRCKSGNMYLLVIVCGYTKYSVLRPTRNTKTEPVIKVLSDVMSIFGQPVCVTTDRGTGFTSKKFESFLEENGVQHIKTATRTPRANGQAERANRTILNALKCMTRETNTWDTHVNTIQWAMNSQSNATTKFTPNELVFNYSPRDVSRNRLIQALHEEVSEKLDIAWKHDKALSNINEERSKWKERYDKRHRVPRVYKAGDVVLVDFVPTATGQSHKLDPAYKGPYMITKVLGHDRYVIEDLPDLERSGRKYNGVHSADHLKPWCAYNPDLNYSTCAEDDEESGEAEL